MKQTRNDEAAQTNLTSSESGLKHSENRDVIRRLDKSPLNTGKWEVGKRKATTGFRSTFVRNSSGI